MKYVFTENNIVRQIIPEIDPAFPGIPITERYTSEFLKQCVAVDEIVKVEINWTYDPKTKAFSPPKSEPEPEQDPEERILTLIEELEAAISDAENKGIYVKSSTIKKMAEVVEIVEGAEEILRGKTEIIEGGKFS